jgi:hypothetical protein
VYELVRESVDASVYPPSAISHSDANLLVEGPVASGKTPAPTSQQRQTIIDAHEFGHFGVRPDGHDWPYMLNHVQTILESCRACQAWTQGKHRFTPLQSVSSRLPWDHVQFDLITSLPTSEDHNYLLVVIDIFSHFVLLRPLKNKSSELIAAVLWEYFCTFGVPKILQHDGESTLVSEVISSLINMHGIEHRTITAYSPRENGKVERAVGTTSVTLRKLFSQCGGDWPRLVPFVQLAINNKINNISNATPF